ncbi:alpha/beta fold hydrolase [Acidimangrovimonas pyrenivorans]|uniref:Alpha/beta fold hydrolase n=1 Tax=Acidimangrovimonas pyrenivorans TaxID=2030798 RepID=A0ABV7AC91_9RHOB
MIWTALGLALLLILAAPWLAERLRPEIDARGRRLAEGDFAELSDGLTYYRWHGPARGPVVVCVHGLTTPSYVWLPIARALAHLGFRVLTYDLYGRGLSDRPGGVQDSAFFLRQLRELLDDQEVTGGITLMGYSMGGAIATAFAAEYPETVDRLVLLAPAGLGHRLGRFLEFCERVPVLGDGLIRLFGAGVHRRVVGPAGPVSSAVPDIVQRMRGEMGYRGTLPAVLSSQRHMLTEDLEAVHRQLGRTKLPVLAIWGEEDPIIPLAALGRMAQLNRSARQVTVPGAGHGLPYTHPREVMAAISDVLREG